MTKVEQEEILQQGAEKWNQWRQNHPNELINLSEMNLYEAELYELNLKDANLSRAFLYGADLRGANLEGADLRDANLILVHQGVNNPTIKKPYIALQAVLNHTLSSFFIKRRSLD